MPTKKFSGATEITIDAAGNSFTSGNQQVIAQQQIMDGTSVEFEEDDSQSTPQGGNVFSGQFANINVETSDFDVQTQLETWRTGDTNVDIRFKVPDGAGGTNNEDYLDLEWRETGLMRDTSYGEAGLQQTLMGQWRGFKDDGLF